MAIFSRIMHFSSLFLSTLIYVNIASNITEVYNEPIKIDDALSSENETLLIPKTTMNTTTSKTNESDEIGVRKNGVTSKETFFKEESIICGENTSVPNDEYSDVTDLAQFIEVFSKTETNADVVSQNDVRRLKCNISNDCDDPRMQCANETCFIKCNNSADCDDVDPRMTCRMKLCLCSRFHYRDPNTGECITDIEGILLWSRKSANTDSNVESQPSAFKVKQWEPYTILEPIWTEYKGNRDIGLGFIPTPVWVVVICISLLLVIYSLIIFDLL